jgi:RNA polymerase sigma factor (sigma-70 family)
MSEAVASGTDFRAGLPRVLSDERLARRAIKGDERALATIFDRYHQRLYRYCLAIVGDPQDAQDALQNTMVKLLRALPGEQRRIELKPWLYRIAHNESIELLRRRRETRELDPELAAPGVGLAEEAVSRERLRRLLTDLDALPERQRGALVMRELAGLEFAEIGTALGTSPAVARQTLYEARLSLRQMDEGRDMDCEAVMRALSAGDGRVSRRRDLRAHLRTCTSCRRFRGEIGSRERDLAALSPLPAVAAAGLLQGLLAGGASGAGGGGLAAAGAGAAKSAGASLALKGAATVAVVTAIGVGAADRAGLIDAGLPGGGSSTTETRPAASGDSDPSAGAQGSPGAAGQPAAASTGKSAGGAGLDGAAAAKAPAGADLGGAKGAGGTTSAPDQAPTTDAAAIRHPHGKGHEKHLPDASAHGQQAAATHEGSTHGSAGTKSHPAHPATPAAAKPPRISTPAVEKAPPAAPPSTPPGEPNGHGNAPAPASGEAPVPAQTGAKP